MKTPLASHHLKSFFSFINTSVPLPVKKRISIARKSEVLADSRDEIAPATMPAKKWAKTDMRIDCISFIFI
jgi:hypothetical protein